MRMAYFMTSSLRGVSSETNGKGLERQLCLPFGQPDVRVTADRARRDADVAQRRRLRKGHGLDPARLDLPLPALVARQVRLVGDALLDGEDAALAVLARRAGGV